MIYWGSVPPFARHAVTYKMMDAPGTSMHTYRNDVWGSKAFDQCGRTCFVSYFHFFALALCASPRETACATVEKTTEQDGSEELPGDY